MIGEIATGEVEDEPKDDGKYPAVKAMGAKGCKARAAKLTEEQRSEIAKKAVQKNGRWMVDKNTINSYSVANCQDQPSWRKPMRAAEALIRDQFPPSNWPIIPTLLRTAYRAADEIIRDNPILQVKSAEDNRGRIIQWSVDLKIEMAVQNGSLPYDYSWEYFGKPTGRYLQLRFPHSTASVSQVARPERQPRSVVFRENARLRSQPVFEGFDDGAEICGLPHFYIIHGYQNLNFAHIAMPSADSRVDYEFRTENLMKLPHAIQPDPKMAPTEDTDFDLDELATLKDEIEKWRRDHGGDD